MAKYCEICQKMKDNVKYLPECDVMVCDECERELLEEIGETCEICGKKVHSSDVSLIEGWFVCPECRKKIEEGRLLPGEGDGRA